MIFDLFWLLAKIFGCILFVVVVKAMRLHYANKKTRQRLVSQGMFDYPGNDTFLLGSALDTEAEFQKRLAKGELVPHRIIFMLNLLGEKEWTPGTPKFDATKYPMVN